jgi:hypothetical protein
MDKYSEKPLIGIVGVCASGKTTLKSGLSNLGYNCRHIAQEHSYVPDMWKRLTNPDILIFLEVSYESTVTRKSLNWTREEYAQQLYRLRNAIENAQIKISTDELSPQQLIEKAVFEIKSFLHKSIA